MTRQPFRAVTPVIESEEDIDVALRQLMLLDAREKADQAEVDQKLTALKAEIQAAQVVKIGRETMTFADYRSAIEEQIRLYCEPRQAELLGEGKARSRKFSHGEIGWRKSPPKMVDIDGKPATTLAALLLCSKKFGKGGLLNKVRSMLAGLAISAAVAASELFTVEIKLDRKAALKLAQEKKLSPVWLEKHNLRLDEGDDSLFIKPADQVIQTESRNAA